MLGRRSLEFVHPDDHGLAIDNWMQMLAQPGPARRIRQRLLAKDGSWVWFEVTNHNLLADPEHGVVVCEMVDITEEMAAHEDLRAREQLLDRLAETVPVGLMQLDAERQVVYTNDRLHEILGTSPRKRPRSSCRPSIPRAGCTSSRRCRRCSPTGAIAGRRWRSAAAATAQCAIARSASAR